MTHQAGVDDSTATMLHIDMDAFFASVELLDHPELRGQPVIIGHAGGRGVVTSATYEARRLGVHSAMPVSVAMRLAPKAHILAPHMHLYKHYSAEVMRIFRDVTPLVEPLSIDEAFLDVSGARRLLGSPSTIGALVRARVFAETGLTCSVGASSTKFVAKMASQRAKPDGMLVVPESEILDFLHPLPIKALWGVGASTEAALARIGIKTVRELAELPLPTLTRAVGEASGQKLHALALGIDPREIVLERQEKSIGHENTFEFDVADRRVLHRELLKQANQVAVRLRRAGLEGRTVALKLRFSDFTTITRSRTLAEPSDLGKQIYDEARAIFDALDLRDDQRVRLIGVRVEQLAEAGSSVHQPSLWVDEAESQADGWRDAERTIDKLAARFGSGAVGPASLLRTKNPAAPK
ncbi:DNA polymerase IV [Agreia sp.]|uniref:DNA polymerase IV n=1 Tax=Agreia sp. TaxID=1872416 RepID=UPI0035BC9529